MFGTEMVFIIIVAFCVIFALVVLLKIFKKKPKSAERKAKKSGDKVPGHPKADVVKAEKMKKAVAKINKEKLKKIESNSPHAVPVFSREELDNERIEQIKKDVEKDMSHQKKPGAFPGFGPSNFSFPFPNSANKPAQTAPKPIQMKTYPSQAIGPTITNKINPTPPQQVKKDDVDFVKMLKKKGIVKQEQSFGESLIIKEAIDTPASKKNMKKKREMWL